MHVFELKKRISGEEADHPMKSLQAKVSLILEVDGEIPLAAARRIALRQFRELVEEVSEADLLTLSSSEADLFSSSRPTTSPSGEWVQPAGLDLRVVKSAHRIILEVAKRGESGRAVLASELIGASGLSAPTVGRLLRPGEPGYDYIKSYVRISPDGRTKAIDLTPEGRVMASKIRAGVVPT